MPRRVTLATATAARNLQALAVKPAGECTASAPQARGTPRSRRCRARPTTRRTRRRWRRRWRRRRRGSTSTHSASMRYVGHPSGFNDAQRAKKYLIIIIIIIIIVFVYYEHINLLFYECYDLKAYI